MAVFDTVPRLEVTVLVAGSPLAEYNTSATETTSSIRGCCVSTTHIESRDEVVFWVRVAAGEDYARDHKNHALQADLFLDGKPVGNMLLGRGEGSITFCEVSCSLSPDGGHLGRDMKFSAAKIGTSQRWPLSILSLLERYMKLTPPILIRSGRRR